MTIPRKRRLVKPHTVVLHHTGGGTVTGAIATLERRGLGYHYIIDDQGAVTQLVPPEYKTYHAYKCNTGTIGVAVTGGGKFGAMTEAQKEAVVSLCRRLNTEISTLKYITGHKHIDPRGWKIDPRFPGEPKDGVDWNIDRVQMELLAQRTGLIFRSKDNYRKKRGY